MELVGRAPELELLTAVARREGSAGLAARSLLGARPGPVLVAIDDSGGFDETLALAFAGGALVAAAGGVAVGRMSRHVPHAG
jgi:hypothetical protein